MRSALLALCLASPLAAQSGRDTTIYTATRVITASSGKVTSVSVAKVALPSPRVDTVKVPTPGLPVYVYWQPDVVDFVVRWKYALTSSTPPAPVVLPRPPSGSPVRVDTVIVKVPVPGPVQIVHDTVYVPKPTPVPTPVPTPAPAGMPELPRVFLDTKMAPAPAPGGRVIPVGPP